MKKHERELKETFAAYRQHRTKEALIDLLNCESELLDKGYRKEKIFELEEQFAKELEKAKSIKPVLKSTI